MSRKSISVNIARQLWAQCGGFCQNPLCNKYLFWSVENDIVSLVNVAHIIGHGSAGPRSDHALSLVIEKDGIDNLIMLCLECHKVVDELEKRFTVEDIQQWKVEHARKIGGLFSIPRIADEQELLAEVNELLEENGTIFREYGPYSEAALAGEGGDAITVWRRRCLDTILPNNERIIKLIENNRRNFDFKWDAYREMLSYKVHAVAFRDNCLTNLKVNDYKLFPRSFDHFIKTKLGIPSGAPALVEKEEIEYRYNQVRSLIEKFLARHSRIKKLTELDQGSMLVELKGGRTLKVFVTHTYLFTDYTLDRIIEADPAIDAIICSNPYGQYSTSAKQHCIANNIGLFNLGEFMGAINFDGERYLNFLRREDCDSRQAQCERVVARSEPPPGVEVFAFGSFLRRSAYNDVDLIIVYRETSSRAALTEFESRLAARMRCELGDPDIVVASVREFADLKLKHDNLAKVYPGTVKAR